MTVASVLYRQAVCLFHVHLSEHGLFAVVVITGISSCRKQSYRFGLQKPFAQELNTSGRDRNRLDKDVDVADVHELASKHSTRLI